MSISDKIDNLEGKITILEGLINKEFFNLKNEIEDNSVKSKYIHGYWLLFGLISGLYIIILVFFLILLSKIN